MTDEQKALYEQGFNAGVSNALLKVKELLLRASKQQVINWITTVLYVKKAEK